MIKPLKNRIFLEPIIEKKSELIVTEEEKPRSGKVLYVGSEIKQVKPKDVVYFMSGLAYREIKVKNKDYLVCTEDDIACILK